MKTAHKVTVNSSTIEFIMKLKFFFFIPFFLAIALISCKQKDTKSDMNIIFLHHSTGGVIWQGAYLKPTLVERGIRKISPKLAEKFKPKPVLLSLFENYNEVNGKDYNIKEMNFPKASPYGWHNYPYDYYNIWIKNAGTKAYMKEPTLEMLTKDYQVIMLKHCFPVSNIQPDTNNADINSDYKSIANYKLQYEGLKKKFHEFPDTKFILWTGAALTRANVSEDAAMRAQEFFRWVINDWDQPDDNIFIWDFYSLETEGGLYLKEEYATSPSDSHPNTEFAGKAVQLIFNRMIDIIENDGTKTTLTGKKI